MRPVSPSWCRLRCPSLCCTSPWPAWHNPPRPAACPRTCPRSWSQLSCQSWLRMMMVACWGRKEGRSTFTHTAPHWKLTPHVVMGMVFFFLFRPAGSTQTSFFTQTTGRLAPRFFFFPLSSALIHDHNSQPVGFNLCSQLTRWLQPLHRLAAKLDTGGVKLLGQNHFRVKAASASGGQKKSTNKRMNNHVHRTRYALCYRHVHVWAVEML